MACVARPREDSPAELSWKLCSLLGEEATSEAASLLHGLNGAELRALLGDLNLEDPGIPDWSGLLEPVAQPPPRCGPGEFANVCAWCGETRILPFDLRENFVRGVKMLASSAQGTQRVIVEERTTFVPTFAPGASRLATCPSISGRASSVATWVSTAMPALATSRPVKGMDPALAVLELRHILASMAATSSSEDLQGEHEMFVNICADCGAERVGLKPRGVKEETDHRPPVPDRLEGLPPTLSTDLFFD
ncbi:unnamed protein product [Symbiodinium sp. CCMP2592]|nr:unnamed protein product [Symbiodinium sp. CCMP2592]